jgi:adenosylcobinamide-GDP ribazoletransferase
MRKIILALQFLTIIPLRDIRDVSHKEMGGSSAFFVLAGIVQGFLLFILAFLFLKIFPADLVSGFLILVIVLINGGFHLDGLSDTFDAVASRGDRVKKLEIMKDGSVGPIGVSAIVITILLKYLMLKTLFLKAFPLIYYVSVFFMPVVSRWAMVPAIFHAQSARRDGLGNIFIKNTGLKELLIATFFVISCWVLVMKLLSLPIISVLVLVFPLLYFFSFLSVKLFNKKFGGMTGDNFGAVSEISELIFLIMVITWSQKSI